MPTLKKPFTLFLILSHLNAFVLDVGVQPISYVDNENVNIYNLTNCGNVDAT
jgi:hypothetical protein